MCRGGEGGVKGLDRFAAAWPPLTPPAPRLCCCNPGNVSRICPLEYRGRKLFRFHKIENIAQSLRCTGCYSLHLSAPRCSCRSSLLRFLPVRETKNGPTHGVDTKFGSIHCGFKEHTSHVRLPPCSRTSARQRPGSRLRQGPQEDAAAARSPRNGLRSACRQVVAISRVGS